jgi:MFS family permease
LDTRDKRGHGAYEAVAMTADGTSTIRLLHHRAFVRFLYIRVAASVALQVQVVAVGWQMYDLTNSPFELGLIGLVQFIPAIGLFLITGHAADRYDRRIVTFAAQLVEALAVTVLAAATASGRLTPHLLLAMAFCVGIGRAFEQPSLQSVLPNIVPAHALPRAIAASTSASQTAIVAGPALGGALIAISPTLDFVLCALLWLSAGFMMRGMTMERTGSAAATREPLDLKTLFSGLAFIGRHKVVLGAILLDLFAVLLGNATALLPIFARDIFMSGPLSFGALRAAPAVGAIMSALVLTRWPISRRVGRTMFITVAAFGMGTILLALSPTFVLAMGAMGIVGAADTVSVVIRQTLVQLHTPDQMRGRVYSVNAMFTSTANQLGDFRAGAAAAAFGTIPSVLMGGLSTIAVVLISAAIFRELFAADRYEPGKS